MLQHQTLSTAYRLTSHRQIAPESSCCSGIAGIPSHRRCRDRACTHMRLGNGSTCRVLHVFTGLCVWKACHFAIKSQHPIEFTFVFIRVSDYLDKEKSVSGALKKSCIFRGSALCATTHSVLERKWTHKVRIWICHHHSGVWNNFLLDLWLLLRTVELYSLNARRGFTSDCLSDMFCCGAMDCLKWNELFAQMHSATTLRASLRKRLTLSILKYIYFWWISK